MHAALKANAQRLLRSERVMLRVRWAAVAFAFLQIFTYYKAYPPRAEAVAIAFALLLAVGNVGLWSWVRRANRPQQARSLSLISLALDIAVVLGFVFVYTFDAATAIWALIYILPLEGAIRFQLRGAFWTMGAASALYVAREAYGHAAFGNDFLPTSISFRMGIGFIVAAVGGTMASNLVRERAEIERHADALRESEERFRHVFEQGPVGIALTGRDLRFIAANKAFAALLGYQPKDLENKTFAELTHAPQTDEDRERARTLFDGGSGIIETERRHVRADGSVVWIKALSAPVRGRDGKTRYAISMIEDVTERRRAEEALQEALRREQAASENLRQTDEAKTALLSAVSHDLRTPLTVVLGFAETLERQFDALPPDVVRDMTGRIVANARKLERVLANLLDMDRLSRGVVRAKLAPADLASLVRRVVDGLELEDGAVNLELQRTDLSIDSALVERIVENLVLNAVRHGGETTVDVRVFPQNDDAVLAVEDRGPGVPAHLRERIFEPFERGVETHSPGTGVGLSLVQRFAELHSGRAWVEDRPGGGASFRVTFPRTQPQHAGDRAATA